MSRTLRKLRAARYSIATASGLAVAKFTVGMLTGSLAVLASAVDSLLDILMSAVNYLAIRQAEQPADESHPFGHGKFETGATLFQSLIIALTGGWIIFEAVQRLRQGIELVKLEQGMIVLLISIGISAAISRYLRRVARQTDSSALAADALHFSMDVYTNLALVAGLILINLFDIPWFDPVLSMLVGAYIIYQAVKLVGHGLRDMLDAELPEEIRDEIIATIEAHQDHILDFHNLRTRGAGSQKMMDFHLTVCGRMTVTEAHEITERMEESIMQKIPGADITIHIDPCAPGHCPGIGNCTQERFHQRTRTSPEPVQDS